MRMAGWFVLHACFLPPAVAQASDPIGELPERLRERVRCSIAAAERFEIPAAIILAVAEMEGGRPGQWVKNKNGSYDVGPMQLNTRYLVHLKEEYGVTPEDVAAEGCYSYEVAAWRLRRHLTRDTGDVWTRVANYHSRTPRHNAKYQRRLIGKVEKWERWLERAGPAAAGTLSVGSATAQREPAGAPAGPGSRAFGEGDAEERLGALLDDAEAGGDAALLTAVRDPS